MTENSNGGYAVLYVDDEEKALKYFSKAMAGRCRVFTAANVDAAEEVLRENGEQIAVVVSDQRMPGKNGVELLKKVRTEYPGMVRLLTTAYSDLGDAIEAINRGEIFRYIQKPWIVDSLQAEVSGAIDYFLLRRERDLLLAEKLSARQRMVGIERITQLLVFARTFGGLANSDYALKMFLEYLHTLPGARESDGLARVDQWELSKWEAKRITEYVRSVTRDLLADNSRPEVFNDRLSAAQLTEMNQELADELELELSVECPISPPGLAVEWQANRALLVKLMENVYALIGMLHSSEPVSLTIARGEVLNGGSEATTLSFRIKAPHWPGDSHLLSGSPLTAVHPIYQRLLACTLVLAHHGGHCSLDLNDGECVLHLNLPHLSDALAPILPELGWDWLPEMLAHYEPEIHEFYTDL